MAGLTVVHSVPPARAEAVRILQRVYDALHWGVPSREILDTGDPTQPDMPQMGALDSVKIEAKFLGTEPRQISFPSGSHLGVEYALPRSLSELNLRQLFADDSLQRLHLIVTAEERRDGARLFQRAAREDPSLVYTLQALASAAGGRQARFAYPRRRAIAKGSVSEIRYKTEKKGDGESTYYHLFRDEDGLNPDHRQPWLALDETGQPWLVGGDYTVPPEGITG